MLRTALVVVRRTTRVSASSSSILSVVSLTAIATVCPAWVRPRAIFCPQTSITLVAEARRCGGRGGGSVRPGIRAGLVRYHAAPLRPLCTGVWQISQRRSSGGIGGLPLGRSGGGGDNVPHVADGRTY